MKFYSQVEFFWSTLLCSRILYSKLFHIRYLTFFLLKAQKNFDLELVRKRHSDSFRKGACCKLADLKFDLRVQGESGDTTLRMHT
jgi:hypothetical protein